MSIFESPSAPLNDLFERPLHAFMPCDRSLWKGGRERLRKPMPTASELEALGAPPVTPEGTDPADLFVKARYRDVAADTFSIPKKGVVIRFALAKDGHWAAATAQVPNALPKGFEAAFCPCPKGVRYGFEAPGAAQPPEGASRPHVIRLWSKAAVYTKDPASVERWLDASPRSFSRHVAGLATLPFTDRVHASVLYVSGRGIASMGTADINWRRPASIGKDDVGTFAYVVSTMAMLVTGEEPWQER